MFTATLRGSESRSLAERNEIIEGSVGLVRSIAKRFAVGSIPLDDLVQTGFIGVIRAAETWDPSLGRWASYATPAIYREIVSELRLRRGPKLNGLDMAGTVPDRSPRPFEAVLLTEQRERVLRAVAGLLPRYRELIELRWGLGGEPMRQEETADALGISRSTMRKREREALEALRERLGESR